MKINYCDFCKKETEKTFEIVDWDLHNFHLDLCQKCHSELSKLIKQKLKEKTK